MNLFEGLRVGLIEIFSNKGRSLLSMFGVAIGITSVTAMSGIMSGFRQGMEEDIARSGKGRLYVRRQEANGAKNQSSGLTYEDALAIRRNFPHARAVSPSVSQETNAFYRSLSSRVTVEGVSPDWRKLDWNYSLRGRFIGEADLKGFAQVCVLIKHRQDKAEFWRDEDVLAKFFHRDDMLGREIRLGRTAFRVVGIIAEGERNEMHESTTDTNVIVPITSFQKRLFHWSKQIDTVDVDSGDRATSYALEKRVFGLLKRRHRGVEDFRVANEADDIGQMLDWADKTSLIMFAIAGIALFAGGVGIMNITLASMNARIKEIGIRKSVGARERDIERQFLLEAGALSLCGGLLGAALGALICAAIKALANLSQLPPPSSVAASLLVSIGVGLAFSWYPARQAARLDPIEALRHE